MLMRTRYHLDADTLVIDLGRSCPVLSSAPRGGGLVRSRYILNHQVPANPFSLNARSPETRYEPPARYLGRVARARGLEGRCVAMMTAVPLKHLIHAREENGTLWVEAFCTVGLSNAVCAGEPVTQNNQMILCPGTINIVVVTNARLPASGMVGALQVATEGKTAMLLAADIASWTGKHGATGTGTDATVIASGYGPVCRYSGTHTVIGGMIGRVVGGAVAEGIAAWRQWKGENLKPYAT
jgi:adenosylcobinamide hydrolase